MLISRRGPSSAPGELDWKALFNLIHQGAPLRLFQQEVGNAYSIVAKIAKKDTLSWI